MNEDEAIFIMQCSALGYKNDEILVYILPLKMVTYYFVVPYRSYKAIRINDDSHFVRCC